MFALHLTNRVVIVAGVVLVALLGWRATTQTIRTDEVEDAYRDPRRLARMQAVIDAIAPSAVAARWPTDAKLLQGEWCDWRERLQSRWASAGQQVWPAFGQWLSVHGCDEKLRQIHNSMISVDELLDRFRAGGDVNANRRLSGHYVIDVDRLRASVASGTLAHGALSPTLRALVAARPPAEPLLAQVQWKEHALTEAQREKFGDRQVAVLSDTAFQTRNHWRAFSACSYVRVSPESDEDAFAGSLAYYGGEVGCVGGIGAFTAQAKRLDGTTAPPNWAAIGARLQDWAQRAADSGVLPRAQTNEVNVLGRNVDQAPHVVTTLDGNAQAIAQWTVQCMTGVNDACQRLGIDSRRWAERYEGAAARMLGMAVIDVPSGGIDVLASAHTPCFAQQYDGPGRDASCPNLPMEPSKRDYELDNHAIYAEAMPGSTVKPITALAMLADSAYARRLLGSDRAQFQLELAKSASVLFHDRLFCRERGFKDCDRPAQVAAAAPLVGWNAHCVPALNSESGETKVPANKPNLAVIPKAAVARAHPDAARKESRALKCGEIDIALPDADSALSVSTVSPSMRPPILAIQGGRIGLELGNGRWSRIINEFSPEWASECAGQKWGRCRGGNDSAINLLSEAWGQGNALTSPVGVAAMFARLGVAADGAQHIVLPHLIAGYIAGTFEPTKPLAQSIAIPKEHAALIVGGLAQGHLVGTSNSACVSVLSKAECARINWIAGKTGTTQFGHDKLSINARAELCERARAQAGNDEQRFGAIADCRMRPYKWYAALVKSPASRAAGGSGRWDKAVVVLAERNWNQNTGAIDAAGDTAANIAAVVAFEYMKRAYR